MPDLFVADKTQKKVPEPEPVNPGTVIVKKKEHHPFTAFHRFPEGIAFENQEKDEKIHLFIRKHFITNVNWILATVAFALIPLVMLLLQSILMIDLSAIPDDVVLIFLLFYYLIIAGFALTSYVTWFYNIGLVTNLRVVDVDITSIQHKNVAATALSDIVDVEYTQKGFLGNILNYGDVHMQTEGLKPNFEYLSVPRPAQIADIITDLKAGRETS